MEQKELVKQLREFLADKDGVDGGAAPALHLMRHALIALERPIVEVRQEVLEDNHEAEQLRDQLAEREGFIYGLLGELQLIPEVDGEPVDSLPDALAEDFGILETLHGEIANLFERWNESPDAARDKDVFIGAVCNLLQVDGNTPLRELWSALEAKSTYLISLERGIAERDQTIAGLEGWASQEEFNQGGVVDLTPNSRDTWVDSALDLAHAVRRDRSRENRVMANAAESLISAAARGFSDGER